MHPDTFLLGGDLRVRRLGLGTNRLGTLDAERARALLHRAAALGVDLVDTADVYGDGLSEARIGEGAPPGLVVATKGGMVRTPEGAGADGSPAHLRAALRASLGRLKRERVDLHYLHRPDPKVPLEDSVRALAQMRDEGLVRHLGLCNVDEAQLERALAVAPIAGVQNRYHLGDRASEGVLRLCERRGIAFVPWYPLGKGTPLLAPDGAVATVAARLGATPAQVALAWLLQHSPVMVPIPGTTSVAHLEENLGAATVRLGREDVAALDAIAAP